MDKARSSPDDWDTVYAAGRPPWDLGVAPESLIRLIAALPGGRRRVLVPCAGLGHDAVAWAAAGHTTTAVDFAPLAVEAALRLAETKGVELKVHLGDLFNLPVSFDATFDIVWEQTCLSAIDPKSHREYFRRMARVLEPSGIFIGLVWNHGRTGGPPFDISVEGVGEKSSRYFSIDSWVRVEPAITSRNPEYLVYLRKRDVVSGEE